MPVMDGFQATQAIRKMCKEHKEVKAVESSSTKEEDRGEGDGPLIVALTANVLPDVEVRCLAMGMNAVLSKPISFTKLYNLIAQL